MRKLSNLGEIINKEEQKSINGGYYTPIRNGCSDDRHCRRPKPYCQEGVCVISPR